MNQSPFFIQVASQPNSTILMNITFGGCQHWTVPMSIESMEEHIEKCHTELAKAKMQRQLSIDPRDRAGFLPNGFGS